MPIKIPNGTVLVLEQMKDDLERYQPEMTRACRLISDYLAEKKINAINEKTIYTDKSISEDENLLNFISNLGEEEGYIVGYGTLLPIWNSLYNHQKNFKFITCSDVIESLRTDDIITESERMIGIDRLGTDGQIRTGQFIPNKTTLFFMANTITTIAQTELLNQICTNYSVWIAGNEIVRIHASIKDERERQSLGSKLLGLINRISCGLEENKYVFLPYLITNNDNKKSDPNNLLLHNLLENINANQELRSYVVVDDYYIQKFFHFQSGSIYGVYEIVWWLHKRGIIDESRYFDVLNEFRKADIRYIPVSSDEIFFHLKQAVIENNDLIESPQLKTLRSYISASLILGKRPQAPSLPFDNQESLGEVEFLLSLTHSASYAVTKIWMDNMSNDQKQIKSAWIIDYLFLDLLTISEVVGWKRDSKDYLFLVSLSISEFFLNGMQFKFNGQKNSYRRSYYWWVFNVLCEPLFRSNPGLLEKTADRIKASLSSQISDHTESEFDQVVRAICSQLYNDLPDPIKNIIEQDKEFLKNIGIEIINVIQLADILFPSHNFWDQAAKVISGESVVIHAVEPKSDILFLPSIINNKPAISFSHPKTKQNYNVESIDFTFLVNESHENWIDKNINCFCELSRQELQAQANRIDSCGTSAEKFESLDLLKKESIGNYYSNLKDELQKTQTLDFSSLLPPNEQGLKQFFGLEDNKNRLKTNRLAEVAAKKIKERCGLSSAIIRLSSFPIDMPSFLLAEVKKLSVAERKDLFSDLSEGMITPINRIHFIRILVDYEEEREKLAILVNSFFGNKVKEEITAFSLLLTWFNEELDELSGSENWSNNIKLLLTWGHADQIFKILSNNEVPFAWLCEILKEKNASIRTRYLFSRKPIIWEDVLYGEKIDSLSFKILGLGYALNNCTKLSLELQDELLSEIFPWEQNILLPALDLLKYHNENANLLHSFLGQELSASLKTLMTKEDDRISTLNSSAHKNLASLAIDWLSDPELSINGWQILFGIFHNQILPGDLLQSLENIVEKFNYKDLAILNPIVGFIAFYFSTYQATHFSEATRSNLKNQLGSLAEVGSGLSSKTKYTDNYSMNKNDAIALLLESSFQLSTGLGEERMIEEFSSMVNTIISNWEDASYITLRLLNRLIREIPIPFAQKLGKILVEIRSKK